MDTTVHKRSTLHTLVLLTGELEHRRTIGVAALDTAGLLCAGDMQEADGGFEGCEAPLERSGSEPWSEAECACRKRIAVTKSRLVHPLQLETTASLT